MACLWQSCDAGGAVAELAAAARSDGGRTTRSASGEHCRQEAGGFEQCARVWSAWPRCDPSTAGPLSLAPVWNNFRYRCGTISVDTPTLSSASEFEARTLSRSAAIPWGRSHIDVDSWAHRDAGERHLRRLRPTRVFRIRFVGHAAVTLHSGRSFVARVGLARRCGRSPAHARTTHLSSHANHRPAPMIAM